MKIIVLLAFFLPIAGFGQTTIQYQQAMQKFQRFYNAGLADSIDNMFGAEYQQMKPNVLFTSDQLAGLLKEYGTIKSFRFIGIDKSEPSKVYVFETIFSKKAAKATSLTLDEDLKLGTFRFITTSKEIEALLKKSRRSR